MKPKLNDIINNFSYLWHNPLNTCCKWLIFLVILNAALLIACVYFFSGQSPMVYHKYFTLTNQSIHNWLFSTLNQSEQSVIQPNVHNLSMYDEMLNQTLISRAKERNQRYYLNDFEYFRMIRKEFPYSQSAINLGLITGSVPLLPTTLTSKDVIFIIMGSAKLIQRAYLLKTTWLQWTHGNYFIFADDTNDDIPLITLPELRNKSSRKDAQHRQLLGSQWLIKNQSALVQRTKWFVFADDDTWVNVPALLSYLQYFDHRLRLSIGYIWDNMWVPGWAYFSGGAALAYSQTAFLATVPATYTKECPFKEWNDVTFMFCQRQKGVTKIHSDRFFYDNARVYSINRLLVPVSYVSQITFHYTNNPEVAKRMTCDVGVYWNIPVKGCENVTRHGMPHIRL